MIVWIADEKYQLDTSISTDEKIIAVTKLLQKTLVFMDRTMTIEEYFIETWNNPYTIKAMDLISYYMTKVSYDMTTLSKGRMREISRGSDRHVTFGSLVIDEQERLN